MERLHTAAPVGKQKPEALRPSVQALIGPFPAALEPEQGKRLRAGGMVISKELCGVKKGIVLGRPPLDFSSILCDVRSGEIQSTAGSP